MSAGTLAHARHRYCNINQLSESLDETRGAAAIVCLPAVSDTSVVLVAVAMLMMLGLLMWRRNLATVSRGEQQG